MFRNVTVTNLHCEPREAEVIKFQKADEDLVKPMSFLCQLSW